ncbi:hypothetical protein SK128_006545 [Halocaridina rubra]|uniref:BZIP domain-containing protein n=1 Tax=Halocaridina rubra TaxID=373956 RepID=A0AAN8XB26_HALRR
MLVRRSLRQQVKRKRKYSGCDSSPQESSEDSPITSSPTESPTMFTRAQASAVNAVSSATAASGGGTKSSIITSSATSAIPLTVTDISDRVIASSESVITTASVGVPQGTSGATTTENCSIVGTSVPNVSLTITAVAAPNLTDGLPIITTTNVPALDTPTITNLVLNSLEGVHSGVPTRTTPTLTPTTLRNIEQTFLEFTPLPHPENHTNQAGFVPPLVQPNGGSTYVSVDSKCWGGGTLTQIPHTSSSTSSSTTASSSTGVIHVRSAPPTLEMPAQVQQQPSRRVGGRRPLKDEKISVEEEERRCLRRERNKLAAARCRKRRLDQTNSLQDETDCLEEKKSDLQQEIQLLQQQREELKFLLDTHKLVCRKRFHNATCDATITTVAAAINTTAAAPTTITSITTSHHDIIKKPALVLTEDVLVKEEPEDNEDEFIHLDKPQEIISTRPRRPTSLAVAPVAFRTSSMAELGVPIETPSAGLRGLNFDSMMEGGTGLTPVTSGGTGLTPLHTGLTPLTTPVVTAPSVPTSSGNCGSQQRSSSSDLSSPDSVPPKLVSL